MAMCGEFESLAALTLEKELFMLIGLSCRVDGLWH
jgi:hypothetical protein